MVFPIDFNLIRKKIANEVERVTGVPCVLEEPTYQNAPRPTNPAKLPYFSFKIITPAAKTGDDSREYTGTGTVFNTGGIRKMTVSFHCYAIDQETAFQYMALWQSSLELDRVQKNLREATIAVWLIGAVADLSSLLNTGYEGRAHMDVEFGISSNITEDLSTIETSEITGNVLADEVNKVIGPIEVP